MINRIFIFYIQESRVYEVIEWELGEIRVVSWRETVVCTHGTVEILCEGKTVLEVVKEYSTYRLEDWVICNVDTVGSMDKVIKGFCDGVMYGWDVSETRRLFEGTDGVMDGWEG